MAINAKAENMLNIHARSLVYNTYYITNEFDINLSTLFSLPYIGKAIPYLTFIWACIFIDRLHFYYNRGLLFSLKPYNAFTLNEVELYVYKLLGVEIFFWPFGADVRTRNTTKKLGEPNCCSECNLIGIACICDEKRHIRNYKKTLKYSKAVLSMGDMIEYTPGSRNDLFFWPVNLLDNKYKPSFPDTNPNRPVKVVHASNHRLFKGTHHLIKAINNLKQKGMPIELQIVEKIPNKMAFDIYRTADLIFDQCLVGFYGFFAIEAMALGKPVMSFLRKSQDYLLSHNECPIIRTHINTLENDLYNLILNKDRLRQIGIAGRKYVEKYFSLNAFASRLAKLYHDIGVRY